MAGASVVEQHRTNWGLEPFNWGSYSYFAAGQVESFPSMHELDILLAPSKYSTDLKKL